MSDREPLLGPKNDPWMRAYVLVGVVLFCLVLSPLLPFFLILALRERLEFKKARALLVVDGRLPRRHRKGA